MRRTFFYILMAGLISGFVSCKKSGANRVKVGMEHDIRMYHQAMLYGDDGTAIGAMHSLLAWDSTHKSYYDTLAVLYFHSRNYPQAIQAAQEIMGKDPDNIKLLEIVSHAYQYLGRHDIAVRYYARLAELKPEPLVYYELASSYLFLRDTAKINLYVNKILKDKNSDSSKVHITYNQGREQEDVAVKAASHNLMGTLYMNMKNKGKAIDEYKEALKIDPGFGLAKQNLEVIEKGNQ